MSDPTTPSASTPLPTAPNPLQAPAVHDENAYAFMAAQETFRSQMDSNAAVAFTNALSAFEDATAALASANDANAAANAAANASNAVEWVSGSYTAGTVVWSPTDGKSYRRLPPGGSAAVDPGNEADPTNWALLGAPAVTHVLSDISLDLSTYRTLATSPLSLSVTAAVTIDSNREMVMLGSAVAVYAAVYTRDTKVLGALTLVRSGAGLYYSKAHLIGTDKVLVATHDSGSAQAVILTLAGDVITVGSSAGFTGYFQSGDPGAVFLSNQRFLTVGSTYLLNIYDASGNTGVVAMTVSGTTVSVGAPVIFTGYLYVSAMHLVDSSRVLCVHTSNASLQVQCLSVSGTSLTLGTAASLTASSYLCTSSTPLATGRWAVYYRNSSMLGTIASLTGTVVTLSAAVTLLSYNTSDAYHVMHSLGTQAVVCNGDTYNVLTDSSGTAVAGTVSASGNAMIFGYGSGFTLGCIPTNNNGGYRKVGASGNNPSDQGASPGALDTATCTSWAPLARVYGSTLGDRTLRSTDGTHYCLTSTGNGLPPFAQTILDGALAQRNYTIGAQLSSTYKLGDSVLWSALALSSGNRIHIQRLSV